MDSSNVNVAKPSRAAVVQQPIQQMEMGTAPVVSRQPTEQQAMRIRGGGAARDCFMGAIECFLCFESCKACCECCADIICCPCEVCGL